MKDYSENFNWIELKDIKALSNQIRELERKELKTIKGISRKKYDKETLAIAYFLLTRINISLMDNVWSLEVLKDLLDEDDKDAIHSLLKDTAHVIAQINDEEVSDEISMFNDYLLALSGKASYGESGRDLFRQMLDYVDEEFEDQGLELDEDLISYARSTFDGLIKSKTTGFYGDGAVIDFDDGSSIFIDATENLNKNN